MPVASKKDRVAEAARLRQLTSDEMGDLLGSSNGHGLLICEKCGSQYLNLDGKRIHVATKHTKAKTRQARPIEVAPVLSAKLDRLAERAKKLGWTTTVRYEPKAGTMVGNVQLSRNHLKPDADVLNIRFGFSTRAAKLRFLGAERYNRLGYAEPQRFSYSGAVAYMVLAAPPKQAKKAIPTKSTATKEKKVTPTKKRIIVRKKATTAPAKKATAKRAPAAKAVKKATAAKKVTRRVAPNEDAAKQNLMLTRKVVEMRKKDMPWDDIAVALSISVGKARILMMRHEAGPPSSNATPARVKQDRDKGMMSWAAIAAKYGSRKGPIQRLYREAGGDPRSSDIGKGGRFKEPTVKRRVVKKAAAATKATPAKKAAAGTAKKVVKRTAKAAPAAKATPKDTKAQPAAKAAKAPAAKKARAPKAEPGKPLFAEDATKEQIIDRIDGKKISWRLSEKFGGGLTEPTLVKGGTAKVGAQKDGLRIVQFNDGNKTRTVAVESIEKASK